MPRWKRGDLLRVPALRVMAGRAHEILRAFGADAEAHERIDEIVADAEREALRQLSPDGSIS